MDEAVSKLFEFVKQGDLRGLKELVEEQGKPDSFLNSLNGEGQTVLHIAAEHNHPAIIRWLLSSSGEGGGRAAGFSKVLTKADDGQTAMHLAAGRGHLECCQALVEGSLIDNGERVELLNAVENDGWTVLHWAAQEGHTSIIKWLLSSEGGGRGAGFNNVLAKADDGRTAMHVAASNGHLECCQALVEGSLIDNGERVELLNAVENDGWTVLHYAAQEGHASIIKWLLSSEEGGGRTAGFNNVFSKTNNGMGAMHVAAWNGHLECCQALVEGSKIDNGEQAELLNAVENEGWTAMHLAAQEGYASIIKWLLSSEEGGGRGAGFNNVLAKADDGRTAMHLAVSNGHFECCQALVEGSLIDNGERVALLNAFNEEGWTALHYAAENAHASIIKWLLSSSGEGGGRGVGFTNVFAKTNNGMGALHVAAGRGHLECCQALVEGSMIDNGERAELLNGADVEGFTVLHVAAHGGHSSVIRWLLSSEEGGGRGAGFDNVLVRTKKGRTAMHYAAGRGHLECCQALVEGSKIENGERVALLNSVDNDGRSVLYYAVQEGHTSIIVWLLSSSEGGGRAAGFNNVLAKADDGRTAMHVAASNGHLECCQALAEDSMIENGERVALLNSVDNDGRSVLYYAAENAHASIIKWLLSSSEGGGRGVGFTDVFAKINNGMGALHVAAWNGHLECCQALVEGSLIDNGERAELLNGADVEGFTVLHVAAHGGHSSVIRWLLSSEEGGGRGAGFDNVLAKAIDETTAMHVAALYGHLECCQALVEGSLVENGERAELLNGLTSTGGTILHCAAQNDHTSIIEWLLSSCEGGGRGAGFTSSSITAKASAGSSALYLVSQNGSLEALNALLSGCTVGERLTLFLSVDNHGWTPLHAAAQCCQPDIIRELLLHHPETQTIVDSRDHRGMTALHRAVIGGIDEESKNEWQEFEEGGTQNNVAVAAVLSALLIAPTKKDDDSDKQAAMIDPNLGIKIE